MNNIKKIARYLDRKVYQVCLSCILGSGILIIIMGFATTYGATKRYLFNNPDRYAYEFACILLVVSSFLSLAYVTFKQQNFRSDMITNFLPKKVQAFLLNIVSPVLGLVFCCILTWSSWKSANYALHIGETSVSTWRVPLFPVKLIIPIGAALVCLVLITQLCHGLGSLKEIFGKTKQ